MPKTPRLTPPPAPVYGYCNICGAAQNSSIHSCRPPEAISDPNSLLKMIRDLHIKAAKTDNIAHAMDYYDTASRAFTRLDHLLSKTGTPYPSDWNGQS